MSDSDDEDSQTSAVVPLGPFAHSCGYCSPAGERSAAKSSVNAATLEALRLTCDVYQKMIDRGWRRSGTYCYKPDLRASCCPQYTIKLDAKTFQPSKSQRKVINKWNKFILEGDLGGDIPVDGSSATRKPAKRQQPFDLVRDLHASEKPFLDADARPAHEFTVTLELARYTDEKFALYQSYEANIHHKPEKQKTSFTEFLCDSPLLTSPMTYPATAPAHLPTEYGSYHQLYRLDGRLIAMGVIDILPSCVSSVYFMWEKEFEKYSLGKLSAMREVALAREIAEAGAEGMEYLYMGFYIHSCPKMRYKGEYSPSYLADPEDFSWHRLEPCLKQLETHRYACFSKPEHSLRIGEPPPEASSLRAGSFKQRAAAVIEALGLEVARQVDFYSAY
ncbi:unnamed protein product [Peniophora sp. CBMAI 1063]|nr:unnamed protein product [Peniophora sp. CBMAI 1063]